MAGQYPRGFFQVQGSRPEPPRGCAALHLKKSPPLRHPLLIDKSNFDDLHFFCITFLLHHVILFLIKPRQIRPGKLGFWCDKMEPRQIGLWKKVGVAKLTTEVTAHTAHCTVQCTYTVHDWGMFFSVEII